MKSFSGIIAMALALALTACSEEEAQAPASPPAKTEASPPAAQPEPASTEDARTADDGAGAMDGSPDATTADDGAGAMDGSPAATPADDGAGAMDGSPAATPADDGAGAMDGSPDAAATVGSSTDLSAFEGARAGQAEMGIQNLGFEAAKTEGLTTYWLNQATGACAKIVTSDGRYSSVEMVPAESCSQ